MLKHIALTCIAVLLLGGALACRPAPAAPTAVPTPLPAVTTAASAEPQPTAVAETPTAEPPTAAGPWWNDAVFYEIFVRSFYDHDGDGVGDFEGMMAQLDYLNDGDPATTTDLGVTGIWLMPINDSVSYHGYDVVDYYRVEPDFGTQAQLKAFIAEAQARGIRVIIDLVINHTSTQHAWFQQSRNPDSPFRSWYVWSDRPGSTGWHRDESGYYYGIFWDQMPDLNYSNPAVTRAVYGFTRYWLETMNVDGFRLDAIKFLVEADGKLESTPETLTWFADYNAFVKSIKPDALLVGEVWSPTFESAAYVQQGAVDLTFAFDPAEALLATTRGTGNTYAGALELALKSYPDGQFATFITNHDQNRVISQLYRDLNRGYPAATLLLTSPGVPFIYYGEEIGMQGMKPDERIRTPMQWSAAPHAGFSAVEPWQPLADDWQTVNVAAQDDDPNSLLNHYRALIRLRRDWSALRTGGWLPVPAGERRVYAHLRTAEDHAVLVVVNTFREPITDYALNLAASPVDPTWQASALLGPDPAPIRFTETGGLEGYRPFPTLPPLSSAVILLSR